MNKKLLSLAVAAALTAPAAVMADATLYGKLNVSLDYQNIENQIRPVYNNSATAAFTTAGGVVVPAFAGVDYFVRGDNTVALVVPTGAVLTPAQAAAVSGTTRVAPGQRANGLDFEGWGMSDNNQFQGSGRSSRLGVKGSEDLGGGLKAVYQIEMDIKTNDTNNNIADNADGFTWRNTFVGLAGGWGTALMGRHDTPLKISTGKLDLFSDTMADYNGTIGFNDLRVDNAVAYISPSFSGFTLAAAIIPGGESTAGAGMNLESDSIAEGYSIAGIYSNGPFYGSAAYESVSDEMQMSTATSVNSCIVPVTLPGGFNTISTCTKSDSDWTKWRLGLGILNWNGFTLTGIYEQQDNLPGSDSFTQGTGFNPFYLPGSPDERQLWQVQAGYSFGNFMIKGMYGQSSFDGDYALPSTAGMTAQNAAVYRSMADEFYSGDTSSWAIGVDYNFSKRTQIYALYTATVTDMGDVPSLLAGNSAIVGGGALVIPAASVVEWDGFSLGLMHSF